MKCGWTFENGQAVADKVRSKGAADQLIPQETKIECAWRTSYL